MTVSLTIGPFSSHLISPVQLFALDRDDFLEQKHNLLLIGRTGTGKTHLAIALRRNAVRRSKRVRFYGVVDLVNQLEQEKASGKKGVRQNRAACQPAGQCLCGDQGRTALPTVCRKRWNLAVLTDQQTVRAHQPDPDHQPDLQRMGQGIYGREDDHNDAGSDPPSLQDHRDRKRLLQLQTKHEIMPANSGQFWTRIPSHFSMLIDPSGYKLPCHYGN